jgi:hypothetical protein
VVEKIGGGRKGFGRAIGSVIPVADLALLSVPFHVAGDEQVQVAVVVVVEEPG